MSNEAKRIVSRALAEGTKLHQAIETEGLPAPQTLRDYQRMSKNKQTQQAPIFRKACELAKVEPTRRQASKWNNGYGAAWKQRGEARRQLFENEVMEAHIEAKS